MKMITKLVVHINVLKFLKFLKFHCFLVFLYLIVKEICASLLKKKEKSLVFSLTYKY